MPTHGLSCCCHGGNLARESAGGEDRDHDRGAAMSGGTQGPNGRPPHPATVVQSKPSFGAAPQKPPHAATVAQPKPSFGGPAQRPPHPATVAQPKATPPKVSARERLSPHPATVQRKGSPSPPATPARPQPRSGAGDAIQPMWFGGLRTKVTNLVSGLVDGFSFDPLSRPGYTSCVCLVFTNKSDADIPKAPDYFGPEILEGMEKRWLKGRQGPPLRYCSVNDETVREPTSRFWQILLAHDNGQSSLGSRPLIILIGHCAPGSDSLSTMEKEHQGFKWVTAQVFEVVQRVFAMDDQAHPTVFLSMCSSGEPGHGEPSFQDRFDARLAASLLDRGFPDEFFSIGTIGSSCPLPFLGKVVTTGGFRFTRRDANGVGREVRSSEQEKQDHEALG